MRQWRSTIHHTHGNMSKVRVCPCRSGRSAWLLHFFFSLLEITFLTPPWKKLERVCAGQTRGQWRGGKAFTVREVWGWGVFVVLFSHTADVCPLCRAAVWPASPGGSAPHRGRRSPLRWCNRCTPDTQTPRGTRHGPCAVTCESEEFKGSCHQIKCEWVYFHAERAATSVRWTWWIVWWSMSEKLKKCWPAVMWGRLL